MTQVVTSPVFANTKRHLARQQQDAKRQNRGAADQRRRRQAAADRKLLDCGTRELKMRIKMMEAMLGVPLEHAAATRNPRERSRMEAQLAVYRRELERRDARDLERSERPLASAHLALGVSKLKARFH